MPDKPETCELCDDDKKVHVHSVYSKVIVDCPECMRRDHAALNAEHAEAVGKLIAGNAKLREDWAEAERENHETVRKLLEANAKLRAGLHKAIHTREVPRGADDTTAELEKLLAETEPNDG